MTWMWIPAFNQKPGPYISSGDAYCLHGSLLHQIQGRQETQHKLADTCLKPLSRVKTGSCFDFLTTASLHCAAGRTTHNKTWDMSGETCLETGVPSGIQGHVWRQGIQVGRKKNKNSIKQQEKMKVFPNKGDLQISRRKYLLICSLQRKVLPS